MGRTAAGVKGMNLDDGSFIVGATSSLEGAKMLVLTTHGYGKISYAKDTEITMEDGTTRTYDGYRLTSRGAKGVITIKTTPKTGDLCAVRAVNGDEDLLVVTGAGVVIRTPISEIKIAGRNTQGVKIIAVSDSTKVASIAILPHEDPSEEDGEELEEGTDEAPADKPDDPVVTPDEVDE